MNKPTKDETQEIHKVIVSMAQSLNEWQKWVHGVAKITFFWLIWLSLIVIWLAWRSI